MQAIEQPFDCLVCADLLEALECIMGAELLRAFTSVKKAEAAHFASNSDAILYHRY